MTKTALKGSVVHGVHFYRYVAAARTMAEIEILDFAGESFAVQARIFTSDGETKTISTTRTFESREEALQEITSMIEDEIQDDPWVVAIKKRTAEIEANPSLKSDEG